MEFKPFPSDLSGETAVRLMLKQPYFMGMYYSMNLFELPPHWKPPFNTLATNGASIWINTNFWKQLNRDQKMTGIAHECGHPMYLHNTRIGMRNKKGWNIAGDHRINLDLVAAGFTPLEDLVIDGKKWNWYCDPKYNIPAPWTTEAIYDDIMQQAQDEAGKQGKDNSPGGAGIDEILEKWLGDAADICEFGEDAEGNKDGTVTEAPKEFEERIRKQLKEMADMAKSYGDLPAWMKRMVADANHMKVEWWEIVENICQALHCNDYSWKRYSRRHLVLTDSIAPDMYSPAVGGVVIYFDATGSCWDVAGMFRMHMCDIFEELKPAWVEVRYFQTSVDKVVRYERGELEISRELEGGGGTSFRWLADDLENMPEEPEIVFFLTDMDGPWGRQPDVECPIYFLSTTDKPGPGFGQIISIQ